jgi:hypothetical protein
MEWECSSCGATVHEASRCCAGCGKSFERKKRGVGFWLAVAFGCVMLAGVISGILDKSTASSASPPAAPTRLAAGAPSAATNTN